MYIVPPPPPPPNLAKGQTRETLKEFVIYLSSTHLTFGVIHKKHITSHTHNVLKIQH